MLAIGPLTGLALFIFRFPATNLTAVGWFLATNLTAVGWFLATNLTPIGWFPTQNLKINRTTAMYTQKKFISQ